MNEVRDALATSTSSSMPKVRLNTIAPKVRLHTIAILLLFVLSGVGANVGRDDGTDVVGTGLGAGVGQLCEGVDVRTSAE